MKYMDIASGNHWGVFHETMDQSNKVRAQASGNQHMSYPNLENISLVGGWATPLKNMTSSIGMIRNPIYGKIQNGNQTTNQIWNEESAVND